jgi:protein SCO1/2
MWMPAFAADPSASLYQLHEKLDDQDGRAIGLDVHRGHPVLVTMFYASCPDTCPLIVETLRDIERQLDETQRRQVRVLLISFDAEHDTPQALTALAQTRHIDTSRWTLAHADAATVRRIAAALNVQYRQLPSGTFSHSTMISVLGKHGEIAFQSAKLGRADPELVAALHAQ